ncbi:MAG TPA: hypothetical protein P5084_14085 [Paludibacter sp.]|nr:hypothetical protein [Paludibacter sp.]
MNSADELSDEQIEMLRMSEQDLIVGNFISQAELDKSDIKWLKVL